MDQPTEPSPERGTARLDELRPAPADILRTAVTTAVQVADIVFDRGLAGVPRPLDIRAWIEGQLYRPRY
jgi:malate dehydrogenase (oxaloacetate-decarboxylating)(NADP+)